ncbi:hypothetical protein PCC6912_46330 [Chlorogloeopsis fritschii PCC 6912]|uniref:Uncharacterized protein n=1 Tax=Chlorogloeopsis fritschii PCC 6912 TaxID=211165 RepID=A0A433N3D2_CHLFR|nr:hypothetical protein PCC6912_46330 [Chlorogloeopsis fritschii PCC 6912]
MTAFFVGTLRFKFEKAEGNSKNKFEGFKKENSYLSTNKIKDLYPLSEGRRTEPSDLSQ